MAIRAAAGRAAGWFDDAFFLYYEDTDLSWRLRAGGWSVWYQPTAVLRHVHSATSTEWSPLWTFHVDRNRLLMLTKNATAGLALRAVLRYPLTSASMLLRDGLVVRTFPATSPLADFTRITVRRPEENARLLSALKGSLTPH